MLFTNLNIPPPPKKNWYTLYGYKLMQGTVSNRFEVSVVGILEVR